MNRINTVQKRSSSSVSPNLLIWLDASDSSTITLSGSNVTAWRDKASGLSFQRGIVGPTFTSPPTFDSGKTAVSFSNLTGGLSTSSQGLQVSTATFPAPFYTRTYYFVIQFTRNTSDSGLKCLFRVNGVTPYPFHTAFIHLHPNSTGENSRDDYYTSGSTSRGYSLNYTRSLFATNGTKYLVCQRSNATTTAELYINNSLAGSATGGLSISTQGPATATPLYIGGGVDNRCWDGFVHEVRMYNDYHNDTKRTAIQDELKAKWSVSY